MEFNGNWRFKGETQWRTTGFIVLYEGEYHIEFIPLGISGFKTPLEAHIILNKDTTLNGIYSSNAFQLKVILSPDTIEDNTAVMCKIVMSDEYVLNY